MESITTDLERTAWDVIPNIIKPRFVLVTGDLTHGSPSLQPEHQGRNWFERKLNFYRGRQSKSEWTTYHKIAKTANEKLLKALSDSNETSHQLNRDNSKLYINLLNNSSRKELDSVVWIDCPGNHDRFDTPLMSDQSSNMFTQYQCCLGQELREEAGDRVISFTLETESGSTHEFIQIDATPRVGSFSPINFFGQMSTSMMDQLEEALSRAHKNNRNSIVMYGHYPQSVISYAKTSSGKSLQDLEEQYPYDVYLSGHLHTLYNLLRTMKHRSPIGHDEWEMADFKENRILRIVSIDHDKVSHLDTALDVWPKVLVTHPMEANCYCDPVLDEIRLLIFSPGKLVSINITIDNIGFNDEDELRSQIQQFNNQQSNMIRLRFDPLKYQAGVHQLNIIVEDTLHNRQMIQHTFSLDDSNCGKSIIGVFKIIVTKIILFTRFDRLLPFLFHVGIALGIIILVVMRQHTTVAHKRFSLLHGFARVSNSCYFHVLISVLLWMPVLPLFVGEAATNRYALFYHWGLQYLQSESVTETIVLTPDLYFGLLLPLLGLTILPFYVTLGVIYSFPKSTRTKHKYTKLFILLLSFILAIKRMRVFWDLYVRRYGQYSALLSPCGLWLHMFIVSSLVLEIRQVFRNKQE